MSGKKKERNYVDLYSDYGLDERQKAVTNELGLQSFKMLCCIITVIAFVWLGVHLVDGMPYLPPAITELTFFAAVMFCRCYYAVKASGMGAINQISSFSYTTGGAVVIMILLILTVISGIMAAVFPSGAEDTLFLALFFGIFGAQNIVLYICGKRNVKALEEQAKETEEN